MRRLWPSLLIVLLAGLALSGCLGGDDDDTAPTASAREHEALPSPAITRAELEEHLAALQRIAERNGGTRAAGTPGYDQSASYVATRLEDAGWRVTRQPVPFTYFQLKAASLTVGGRELRRNDDFQVYSYSGSGSAGGRLRPFGLGCAENDFDGL